MDRERFEHLLAAYGADFRRWPEADRAAGETFAREHADASTARNAASDLDAALDAVLEEPPDTSLLARRILKAAPQRPWINARAAIALAACAVFGVIVGYSGGLLAPTPDFDDSYFASAFEAPAMLEDEG